MRKAGPILVPLDGSPLAEGALPYALALADALGAGVVLITAMYTSELPGHERWTVEFEQKGRELSQEYLEGVPSRLGRSDITTVVRAGYAHDEILRVAEEQSARAIVAASHGRSGLRRWVYGSMTGHLIHESPIPVLVVVPDALASRTPHFEHIMVPLDGSRMAEQAIAPALDLARALQSRVTFVRALPFAAQAYPYFTPGFYLPQLDQELEAGARAYLERMTKEFASGGVPVAGELRRGAVSDCLLGYVEDEHVGLVIMTTHARAGLARTVLGSTADRMLHGRAPVLLIRPTPEAEGAPG